MGKVYKVYIVQDGGENAERASRGEIMESLFNYVRQLIYPKGKGKQ